MGNPLFAKKPMSMLLSESAEAGAHSLKRTLGPFQLTALGVGAIIGAGIFVLSGLGAHYAGPGLMLSFVLSGLGCAFAGLCYAEFAAMIPLAGSAYTYAYATLGELLAWIIGWDLSLVPGTQAFLLKVTEVMGAQSPVLAQRARELLNAPTIFGVEFGFNLPAFVIALVITAILVVGIKESARFNATIVVVKVCVVLFVIWMGFKYVNTENWGHDWSSFAPYGFSGIGAGAAYIFFAYIGFDAVSTTAQEAKNPQRDLPIGIITSLVVCTALYILVASVLTGMVSWREINIEAPIARAFLDRGLTTASHVITVGALAGLTSVMLVMMLGQTRVLYAMAKDGLLPQGFFAAVHPKFRTPWKNTILVGFVAAIVGSVTPIDDIGKMVNIGTLLAFVIVCIAIMVLRKTNPGQARPFRTPWVPLVPILGIVFNGYMMYKLGWINWARLIVWLIIGLIVYFSYGRHHSHLAKDNAAIGKL